jgi:hypothetical protein
MSRSKKKVAVGLQPGDNCTMQVKYAIKLVCANVKNRRANLVPSVHATMTLVLAEALDQADFVTDEDRAILREAGLIE